MGGDTYTPLQQPAGGYGAPSGSPGYGPSQSPRPPQPGKRTTRAQWKAKAVAEFLTDNRQDRNRLTDYDAKQLNIQVTSSYAKLYLSNPSIFKWAGMAAFASKEVGKGMAQAWELGFGAGTDPFTAAAVWVGGLVTGRGGDVGPTMGKLLFWALSGGNRLLWDDIVWQHVAYRDAGFKALQEAREAGEVPESSFAGWSIIDSAVRKKEIEEVWMGNALLLLHEQQQVLQPLIYDAKEVKHLWPAISADVPTPIPGHGVNFIDYVPGGNIGNFTDRWKWIFESMLPAWQKLETDSPAWTKKLIGALR